MCLVNINANASGQASGTLVEKIADACMGKLDAGSGRIGYDAHFFAKVVIHSKIVVNLVVTVGFIPFGAMQEIASVRREVLEILSSQTIFSSEREERRVPFAQFA